MIRPCRWANWRRLGLRIRIVEEIVVAGVVDEEIAVVRVGVEAHAAFVIADDLVETRAIEFVAPIFGCGM